MDARIEALETKISYQEHLIQELNEVVISQQNQMDKLEKSLEQLRDYIRSAGEQQSSPEQEAPPPHY
jgi:SlyX protein